MQDSSLFFLLGGHDLEMLEIRRLLEKYGVPFCDKGLRWGAMASAYSEEIAAALQAGQTPALVELPDDMELGTSAIIVDHHGARAGIDKPSSLRQAFDLLRIPENEWTRWRQLVEANDIGYIPAMKRMGASLEEIKKVRRSDRAAQGITSEQEKQGKIAIAKAKTTFDGQLTVVHLPHNRAATVTDRLHPALGGPGYENLLVTSIDEVIFFGEGPLILALNKKYPGGWLGGELPERGFWGIILTSLSEKKIIAFIEGILAQKASKSAGEKEYEKLE